MLSLSERERWIYRFLVPSPNWTLRWKLGLAGLCLGVLLAFVPGWGGVGGFVFVMSGLAALPFLGLSDSSGMGLASVFGITENHGGFTTVTSRVGEGSCFSVFLPAQMKSDEP